MFVRLSVRRFATRLRTLPSIVAFLLLPAAVASAAPPPTFGGQPEPKTYVYQYMFVGICVALGLVLLTRPKTRIQDVDRIAD